MCALNKWLLVGSHLSQPMKSCRGNLAPPVLLRAALRQCPESRPATRKPQTFSLKAWPWGELLGRAGLLSPPHLLSKVCALRGPQVDIRVENMWPSGVAVALRISGCVANASISFGLLQSAASTCGLFRKTTS